MRLAISLFAVVLAHSWSHSHSAVARLEQIPVGSVCETANANRSTDNVAKAISSRSFRGTSCENPTGPTRNPSDPTVVENEHAETMDIAQIATVPIIWHGAETSARAGEWIARFQGVSGSPQEQLDAIGRILRATRVSCFGEPDLRRLDVEVTRHLGMDGLVLIRGAHGPLARVYQAMFALPGVEYVEPNFTGRQLAGASHYAPQFCSLWGLHNIGQTVAGIPGKPDADIDAPEAWTVTRGSRRIVVAVIDTGVDYTHPDLVANIWRNPGEIADNGIDDDGNGFIDDVCGWDFGDHDNDPAPGHWHGTAMAGIIGAVGGDCAGIVGVNWQVQMMVLKTEHSDAGDTAAARIAAINYATKMRRDYGVNVMVTNNSWTTDYPSLALKQAIAKSGDEGILFVTVAGHKGQNNDLQPVYPASYELDNVISVAGTDNRDELAAWFWGGKRFSSNYGVTSVDLAAPARNIRATIPGGYITESGTSAAGAYVSGVAALAWSLVPEADYRQIRDAIFAGVDPLSSLSGKTVTGGRLNACGTIRQLKRFSGTIASAWCPSRRQHCGPRLRRHAAHCCFSYQVRHGPFCCPALECGWAALR